MTRRRIPRNDAAVLDDAILLEGEIAYDTSNRQVRLGDGETAGGRVIGEGVSEEALASATTLSRVGAQPLSLVGRALQNAVSITELGGAQNFDFNAGTGTTASGVKLTNFANDAGAGNLFVPGSSEQGFLLTSSLVLSGSRGVVGEPKASTHTAGKTAGISKLAFRPTGADKVAVKAAVNEISNEQWGQFVSDIAVDCNNFDHNGVQFADSYSNAAKNLSLWGDMNVGLLYDAAYVVVAENIQASGIARFKNAVVVVGHSNAAILRNIHTGNVPASPSDRVYGILINGLCHGALIENPILQGLSVGIHADSGATAITIVNPYYENVVTPEIFGNSGGTGPEGVTVIGGTYAGPYANHPQYASRFTSWGWERGAAGSTRIGARLEFQPNPAFRTGSATTSVWGLVAKASGGMFIRPGSWYDDPTVAGKASGGDMLMRESAGDSPAYRIEAWDRLDHGQWQTWLKRDGSYAGNGVLLERDNTGAEVATLYTPTAIPDPVPALFTPDAPTIASLKR